MAATEAVHLGALRILLESLLRSLLNISLGDDELNLALERIHGSRDRALGGLRLNLFFLHFFSHFCSFSEFKEVSPVNPSAY